MEPPQYLPCHIDIFFFFCEVLWRAERNIMARWWGLSCNDVLACLDVLSDVDSEHEDDTEDSLSWDESDP